jgi:ArsR family transcriptional regulator, arsenate/arsenite/antimonite-responsive transcriptional repressor
VDDIPELYEILKSLSDQTRYKILKMLLARDYCVGGLARSLNISEAAVSQHLKILKEAGIVTGNKHGYFMHYQVDVGLVEHLANELMGLTRIDRVKTSECQPHARGSCLLCNKNAASFLMDTL